MLPATEISKKPTEISIWLDENSDDEKYLKKFHCPICGKIVFEYYTKVRIIIPGEHTEKNPKVIECGGKMILCEYKGVMSDPEYIDMWRGSEHRKSPTCQIGELKTVKCRAKFWIS